jgi:hypothetical protein
LAIPYPYIVVWVIISIIMCTKILNEKIQTSPWVVAPWRKCKSWMTWYLPNFSS